MNLLGTIGLQVKQYIHSFHIFPAFKPILLSSIHFVC